MSAGRFPHGRDVAEVDWRTGFVEDMAALVLVNGTPRAVLRVLGWMVVCEPPEQTASDIQENLALSAGSVSAAARSLCDMGMLERATRPGDRRIYYRLREHAWEKALAARFRVLTEVRRVAERAIDAAGGDADERLTQMRDTYALVQAGIHELSCHSRQHTGREPAAGTRIATRA